MLVSPAENWAGLEISVPQRQGFRPQQKIRSSLDLWPVKGNFATFLKG